MAKHFIDIDDISSKELRKIIDLAKKIKKEHRAKGRSYKKHKTLLENKGLAMIFEKTSTRTRVSFDVAINQLGGFSVNMNKGETQLSKGETPSDTAKVLSRYVDAIMIRASSHQTILDLAHNSEVPVINALSDYSHPCQIMASIMAIEEHVGDIKNKKIAWFGDANNVLTSYIHGAKKFGYKLAIAIPSDNDFKEFANCDSEISKAQSFGADIKIYKNPQDAARDANVLVTDTWFSMGDAAEHNDALRNRKINLLMPYQVNKELIGLAKKDAIFTHCLPAYRGYEVSGDVIDSEQSIVFDEAENRLHVQKAILLWTMSEK